MPLTLSSAERFLSDFHDKRPGITAQAFMALPASKPGRTAASSYAFLVDVVPKGNIPLTVLDAACGDGYLLELVAQSRTGPATLIGIDLSRGELAAAKRRLGETASLIEGRAQAMPLPPNSVDVVLCHMALMLMDDLDQVIAEFKRVLKPGGLLSFVVSARPEPGEALHRYIQILRATRQHLNSTIPRLGDKRLGDAMQTAQLLTSHFDHVAVEDISISRRYTPLQMWNWFDGMYDLDGISNEARESVKIQYTDSLLEVCDSDGCVEFTDNLRQATATAA